MSRASSALSKAASHAGRMGLPVAMGTGTGKLGVARGKSTVAASSAEGRGPIIVATDTCGAIGRPATSSSAARICAALA